MTTHREIESKFDVAGEVDLSGLDRVPLIDTIDPPVEQQLDAEYYDTSDLRLLAAGIGLRRRTGGADAGWHLKIPRSQGERIEVQRPLGRSAHVPKALRDLVTVHLRDAELVRVARVHTDRRVHRLLDDRGAVIAEVADDRVQADDARGERRSWRELEVELVDNDNSDLLAALADVVVAAGASPSAHGSKLERAIGDIGRRAAPVTGSDREPGTAGAVVADYLEAQVAALVALDPAVRVDVEDAVHKMRVAVRRLRSALATYRRLLDRDVAERLRDELQWLGAVLGPVRDAEVIRDHLDGAVRAEPAALVVGPVRRRVDSTLDREHRQAHRQAITAMTSPRYLALVDALEHIERSVTDRKRTRRRAHKELREHVARAHRRMRRALDEALSGEGPTGEQLHEVRKAAKRVRYAAESVADVYGAEATALASAMEEAQQALGDHQDTVVIRAVVRRLAGDAAAAGESTFTYGRLHALEQARGDRARQTYLEAATGGSADAPHWLQ